MSADHPPVVSSDGKSVFADHAAAALIEPHLRELEHPGDQWQLVKRNASRSVYRGWIGNTDIYLKHFHTRSALRRMLGRLGIIQPARIEFEAARLLAACGVKAIPVLAMTRGKVPMLASRAVPGAVAADKWHDLQLASGDSGPVMVRKATLMLADLVARMHLAGISHEDLHCGNILVRSLDGGQVELVMTDLHRIRRSRRLTRRKRAMNLAQLLHDRLDYTSRTDRLRFLRQYLRVSGAAGSLRGWQMLVETLAVRHSRRQFAHLDRRTLRKNKYFSPIRLPGGWRGHAVLAIKHSPYDSPAAVKEFTAADWQEALADPRSLMSVSGAEVVEDSSALHVVRRKLTVGRRTLDVLICRPRRPSLWKTVRDCCRGARTLRAFRLGHALLARRIPAAIPLACIQKRIGPVLVDSLLVTECVEGPGLNAFFESCLGGDSSSKPLPRLQQRQLTREVLWQLGRMLQRLHDNDVIHHDLKESGLVVQWRPPGRPRLVLRNLLGLRRVMWITARRRFQSLMRLNVSLITCPSVSRSGRMRMLLGYLRRPGLDRIGYKPYWRQLEAWSHRKIRRRIRLRRQQQKAVRRPGV